jgi:hypothetical protein
VPRSWYSQKRNKRCCCRLHMLKFSAGCHLVIRRSETYSLSHSLLIVWCTPKSQIWTSVTF